MTMPAPNTLNEATLRSNIDEISIRQKPGDLPRAARRRYEQLRDERSSAELSSRIATDRLRAADEALSGKNLDAHTKALLAEERADLQVRQREASNARQVLVGLIARIEQWLGLVPPATPLYPLPDPVADDDMMDDPQGSLAFLRKEIKRVSRQVFQLECASPTREDLLARARKEITRLAAEVRLDPNTGLPILAPGDLNRAESFYRGDEMFDRVAQHIVAHVPPGGIPVDARPEELAALRAALFALCEQEEAVVRASGLPRRTDADPSVVLGVTRTRPVRRSA